MALLERGKVHARPAVVRYGFASCFGCVCVSRMLLCRGCKPQCVRTDDVAIITICRVVVRLLLLLAGDCLSVMSSIHTPSLDLALPVICNHHNHYQGSA
jgi:hypothetical protein